MTSLLTESAQPVPDWLGGLRLEQYCHAFLEAGLKTLWECRELTAAQLEQMGVALPGHRKRILGSLHKLFSSERGMEGEMEREGEGGEEDRPVPRERTKFRTVHATMGESGINFFRTQKENQKGPPPIPPRMTPNRPPVPFTATSVTVQRSLSHAPVIITNPVPVTEPSAPFTKTAVTPAAHIRPTPTPVPRPRPENLPLKEMPLKQQSGERKPSPVSPSVSSLSSSSSFSLPSSSSSSSSSEQFHLYEQCSSPGQADVGAPPLPPKAYVVGASKEPKVAPSSRRAYRPPIPPIPPIPPRITMSSKSMQLPKSPSTLRSSPVDDFSEAARFLDVPSRNKPAKELRQNSVPLPARRRRSDCMDSSDEYEEAEKAKCENGDRIDMADKNTLQQPPEIRKTRYSSLCSDDELLEEDLGYDSVAPKRDSWIEDCSPLSSCQNSIYLPGQVPHNSKDSDPQLTPVIKMGWLYKNPPQGSLIYQHRWVKLDADYLRYFDSEKDVYSKRIIPTSSITGWPTWETRSSRWSRTIVHSFSEQRVTLRGMNGCQCCRFYRSSSCEDRSRV
ncbi:uncharacterized protein LOC143478057 [Brachyhypopomus gauderio]|uniref:uncharacterized protein LOC143478057 n=1 Tax=Brachyhypopomus gauderio TaxID=698409 RepID=UPI004040FD2D